MLPKLALALMLALSMASCSTTRVHTSAVRDSIVVIHDTVFSARLQYDSTFHDRYHSVIALDSVVYVRDSVVLYRYRLKHDSVFVHRTDTAFVEHRIVKRVEVPRRRSWMDYTSYAALAILVVLLVRKVHSRYSTTY
ncbi:MAG: hypothetical protein K6E45_02675 [Bacteroidaceae bacterium]|nr:hypothetical protein [Bacteroidaceae bacterium]